MRTHRLSRTLCAFAAWATVLAVCGCAGLPPDDGSEIARAVRQWRVLQSTEGAIAAVSLGELDGLVRNDAAFEWAPFSADPTGAVNLPARPVVLRFQFEVTAPGTFRIDYTPVDNVLIWIGTDRVPDENLLATFGQLVLTLGAGTHAVTFHVSANGEPIRVSLVQGGALSGRAAL